MKTIKKIVQIIDKSNIVFFGLLLSMIYIIFYIPGTNFFETNVVIQFDYNAQHIPFYEEFFRLIDVGDLSWSWNILFGNSFYASKAYYLIGDLFAWAAYFINKHINNISLAMTFVLYAKFVLGGTGFCLYLQKMGCRLSVRIIFSLLFIFAGWNSIFIEHPVFTSFYTIIPWILLGVEIAFKNHKYLIFVLSSAWMLMTNYYLTWPFCVFLLFYWIFRFIIGLDKFSIKRFLLDSIYLLLAFFIALGLSSIIWYPSLKFMLHSSRLGMQEINPVINFEAINFGGFITNLLIPIYKYSTDLSLYNPGTYYFSQYGLYVGVICLVLLPSTFVVFKRKRERISIALIIMALIAMMISPIVGKVFHFTYSLRYTFIITLTSLILSALTMQKTKEYNVVALLIGVGLVGGLFYLSTNYYFNEVYLDVRISDFVEYKHLLYALYLSIAYAFVLLMYRNNTMLKTLTSIAVIMLVLIEISLQALPAFKYQRVSQDFVIPYENEYSQVLNETYAKLKTYDNSIYRIYTNLVYENMALPYGIMDVSTYDSTYQLTQRDFLDYMREYPDIDWNLSINEPTAFELVGVKYAIVKADTEGYLIDPWYCEEIDVGNDRNVVKVYRYYSDGKMAMSYNEFGDKQELAKMSNDWDNYFAHDIHYYLRDKLTIDLDKYNVDDYSEYIQDSTVYQRIKFDPKSIGESSISFDFELENNTMMFFAIPYDEGWKVTDNMQIIEIMDVNGGFIGMPLRAGSHSIMFEFSTPGLSEAMNISNISKYILVGFVLLTWVPNVISLIKKVMNSN